MRTWQFLALCVLILPDAIAQSICGNAQLQLTPDYSFAVGSSSGGGAYTLTLDGKTISQGALTQRALFHYDNSAASTSGVAPSAASSIAYDNGKFGKGLYSNGTLTYPAATLLDLSEGTIEMWIAPRYDGSDPVWANRAYQVFFYAPGNGDYLAIGEGAPGRVVSASASANGQQAVAYNGVTGDISAWKAGEWHHLAATFSASAGQIRFYLDGVKIAENGRYLPPLASGASLQIGSTAFVIDELRISKSALPDSTIAFDASHSAPFPENEVVLPLTGVAPGQLNYSVTGCGTATYRFTGIPITNLNPPGGLLRPGSTSFSVKFNTVQPTTCRYSVGQILEYAFMQALDAGPPSVMHDGTVTGVSSDPRITNRVYFRCASNPDYLLQGNYRTVASPGQVISRIGNIWLAPYVLDHAPDDAQKTQLFVGANSSDPNGVARVAQLRNKSPGVLNLPAMIPGPQPDGYFLKDIHGKPIANWCVPELYMPNQTKPEVAQFFARTAYEQLAQSNFLADGIFFDQFNTSIQQPFTDCHGNAVQIDSDGDGIADDPKALNAMWKAGMYAMIDAFRRLAPNAYVMGHIVEAAQPEALSVFNGIALEFFPQSVREGQMSFGDLWDLYQTWDSRGVSPALNMIQACPPNQLSYGYGYDPTKTMLPATIAFAQSSYPNMRFGLGLTRMGGGFFGFDFGDSAPPVAWWYDEFDFNLGPAISLPVRLGTDKPANLLTNGNFETDLARWQFNVNRTGPAKATAAVDASMVAEGRSSAHVRVESAGAANFHVSLSQSGIAMSAGAEYRVQFWARSDSPRTITVFSPGTGGNNPLNASIAIGTNWNLYSASFLAPATITEGQLNFWVGDVVGDVWLDDVHLYSQPALYHRDFTNGVVLLNGSASPQTVLLEPGLKRFSGAQAPLYQYLVDDADSAFSSTGSWRAVTYDTGIGYGSGSGPFYHCWKASCHQLDAGTGQAQWNLRIPADGQYTIQAWLPAAPGAAAWTKNAIYEVVAGGSVLASMTIDQTTAVAGDALHPVATLSLKAADAPFLRVRNGGSGALIADAVYVTSAARYNDGSPARQVTIGAFDSILLQREQPLTVGTGQVTSVVNAASFQSTVASGAFVSIVGAGFGNASRSWTASDFSGVNLPVSLDGVSVTINGKPAYVQYVSPTQINALAPDDDTIGEIQVQVTTPQGPSYAATILKQKLSPAFFSYQSGATSYVAAVHLDGMLVGPAGRLSRPAVPGEVIEIFGTGFGPANPAVPTSQLVSQPAPLSFPATVTIGGVNAQVQWAGLISSGLYQLNVAIPAVGAGDLPVQTSVSGFESTAKAFIAVAR